MIKGLITAIGLMIALPFYFLYLIGKGIAALFGFRAQPKPANRKIKSLRVQGRPQQSTPERKTKEFDVDELEQYDAILDD